jgi:hypothetical protein
MSAATPTRRSEISGFDPTGMPAREAFPDYDAAQDAMDQAFRSGLSVTHHEHDAVLRIRPLWFEGRVWGLATCWLPLLAGKRPALDLQLPPLALEGEHADCVRKALQLLALEPRCAELVEQLAHDLGLTVDRGRDVAARLIGRAEPGASTPNSRSSAIRFAGEIVRPDSQPRTVDSATPSRLASSSLFQAGS